jgi:hypothetical protein
MCSRGLESQPRAMYSLKVDVPNSVSNLKHTPTFQWCMVGCESKYGHQI